MIPARYYDGLRARAHDVRLRVADDQLLIDTPEGMPLATWPVGQIETTGSWDRGGPFGLSCSAAAEARLLLPDQRSAVELHVLIPSLALSERARRRRAIRMGALGTVAAALLLILVYEALPRVLAASLPSTWLVPLGDSVMLYLVDRYGSCSDGLAVSTLERLANRLAESAGHQGAIRVTIIDWSELNAFALPGDRIVLLGGLLDRTGPDELAGVLAHEVGHVVHRHIDEAVVRALGVQAVLVLFTGTGNLTASTAASVAELGYSRAAEAEADRFAVAAMRRWGLRVAGLRSFFERIAKEEAGYFIPGWLSTHPASAERASAIPDDSAGVDPFTSAEWHVIRSACH